MSLKAAKFPIGPTHLPPRGSSRKLQETSLLYIMYNLEWFFVCRFYDMNAYKIQQAEFSYRRYTGTVNTASEEDGYVQAQTTS
jgi:hypothetical protein